MSIPHVVIVGAGIAGASAAWELTRSGAPIELTLLDAGDRVGGKLRAGQVAGVAVDLGAESMLARRPEGVDLARELGMADQVVHPRSVAASIWSRDRLWPIPGGTLMGVPGRPAQATGLLSPAEVARAEHEPAADPLDADISVGDLVAARMGQAVVDRLVEPLLGGVYAGQARRLSVRATIPGLWPAARDAAGLAEYVLRAAAAPSSGGPVFAGMAGGVSSMAARLGHLLAAQGVRFVPNTIVRQLDRTATGWRVVSGPTPAPSSIDADAVILATPATPTARLLHPHAGAAAAAIGQMEYASTAIVTLALPAQAMVGIDGSGLLVPPVEGRTMKAATFVTNKWQWMRDAGEPAGVAVLRASVGRLGETAVLQRTDDELAAEVHAELGQALGRSLAAPVDTVVQRWGGALPQYTVGHLDRVATARSALAGLPGLELAGAAYDGLGIPACIASGRAAAAAVQTWLGSAQRGEAESWG